MLNFTYYNNNCKRRLLKLNSGWPPREREGVSMSTRRLFLKSPVASVPSLFRWLAAFLFACLSPFLLHPLATTSAESLVTIDSPVNGDQVDPGLLRIEGQFNDAYDVKLIVNGTDQISTHMVKPNGSESGQWYVDIDTRKYDGGISFFARGIQSTTRYGVTTPKTTVYVNNTESSIPSVNIVSPIDGSHVSDNHKVKVKIEVESKNRLKKVEVRVNGGPWKEADRKHGYYEYKWDTKRVGDRSNSLEARAIDRNGNIGRSTTVYVSTAPEPDVPSGPVIQDRAMWIWEKAAYNLFLNPGSRNALKQLADDTETFGSDPITTFYIGVYPYGGVDILEEHPDKVRDFVQWAHDNGYKVHACIAGGTLPPYLGALEEYHQYAIREMEKVINFNLSSSPSEQFDGVNVDIEPYIMPEFRSEKPSLQLQYLDILQKMIDRRDKAGIDLPFGPAIPRWFDSSDVASDITWNGETKWLSQHVQDMSDYISIMDYRDQAEGGPGIIPQAQGEIDYANQIGKPKSVVIGVETLDIANSGDPETITFREEGRAYMESELDKVYAAFNDNPAFAGIAMHHYDSIRWLPSAWGPGGVKWTVTPEDVIPPSEVSSEPVASTFDFNAIDLQYGRALDDNDIEEYIIYRSTEPDFIPDESNTAGRSRNLEYRDIGLLPETTYYYKVAAVDFSGNIGPASGETSATTAPNEQNLKPMAIGSMEIVFNGTRARATMTVIDLETGEKIPAEIFGRFTYNGGLYGQLRASSDGSYWMNSETLPATMGQVGFWPQRILSNGYYWATAYDNPKTVSITWPE